MFLQMWHWEGNSTVYVVILNCWHEVLAADLGSMCPKPKAFFFPKPGQICIQICLTPGWRNRNAIIKILNRILNFEEKKILLPVSFCVFKWSLLMCICVGVWKSSFCQYFVVWSGVDSVLQEGVKSFPCY